MLKKLNLIFTFKKFKHKKIIYIYMLKTKKYFYQDNIYFENQAFTKGFNFGIKLKKNQILNLYYKKNLKDKTIIKYVHGLKKVGLFICKWKNLCYN